MHLFVFPVLEPEVIESESVVSLASELGGNLASDAFQAKVREQFAQVFPHTFHLTKNKCGQHYTDSTQYDIFSEKR